MLVKFTLKFKINVVPIEGVAVLLKLIDLWHNKMNMPIRDPEWYPYAVEDELQEYLDAVEQKLGILMRVSEAADVLYCITRAQHDGYPAGEELMGQFLQFHVVLYMFAKLSARRLFYLHLSKKLPPYTDMYSLRNPRKIEKLISLAQKHGYDEAELCRLATRQLKYWPLLP